MYIFLLQLIRAACIALFLLYFFSITIATKSSAGEVDASNIVDIIKAYSIDDASVVGVFRAPNRDEMRDLLKDLKPKQARAYFEASRSEGVSVMVAEAFIHGETPKYIFVKNIGLIMRSSGDSASFVPVADSVWLLVLQPPQVSANVDSTPSAKNTYTVADPFETIFLIDWPNESYREHANNLYKIVDRKILEPFIPK